MRIGLTCTKCGRVYTPGGMRMLSAGFPLVSPVVPAKRRKNAALPGTVFDGEGAEEPTAEEIARVRAWFAAHLDKGIDCPCCTRHAQPDFAA